MTKLKHDKTNVTVSLLFVYPISLPQSYSNRTLFFKIRPGVQVTEKLSLPLTNGVKTFVRL